MLKEIRVKHNATLHILSSAVLVYRGFNYASHQYIKMGISYSIFLDYLIDSSVLYDPSIFGFIFILNTHFAFEILELEQNVIKLEWKVTVNFIALLLSGIDAHTTT